MGNIPQVPEASAIMQNLFIEKAISSHPLHIFQHSLSDLKTQTQSAMSLCKENFLLIFPGIHGLKTLILARNMSLVPKAQYIPALCWQE